MLDPDSLPPGRSPMGLTHCPLCVGLAVLSAVRGSAHLLLLWRLAGAERSRRMIARPA